MTITLEVMTKKGNKTISAEIATDNLSVEYRGVEIPCKRQRAKVDVGGLIVPYARIRFAGGNWLPWASECGRHASLIEVAQEWA